MFWFKAINAAGVLSFCLAKPVLVMIFKGACSVWCSLGCCVMWPVTLLLLLLCRVWPVIAVLSTSVIMVSVHSCRLSCARQCFCRICRSELMVRYAVSIKAVLLSKMSCGFCMDFAMKQILDRRRFPVLCKDLLRCIAECVLLSCCLMSFAWWKRAFCMAKTAWKHAGICRFMAFYSKKICTLSLADAYLPLYQDVAFARDLCGFYGQIFLH